MPIYEYRCRECSGELEKLQRMSDPPLVDCPACGKPGLQRLISAAGFRLKGGGWYETDFKQGQKRNLVESGEAAGKEKSDKSATDKSGEGASSKSGKSGNGSESASKGSKDTSASSPPDAA